MPLNILSRAIFEHYTSTPPLTEDAWYGPWNTALHDLFPARSGYIIRPQRRLIGLCSTTLIPDFIIEIIKISPPMTFRTVVIVETKNTQHWPGGIERINQQLET